MVEKTVDHLIDQNIFKLEDKNYINKENSQQEKLKIFLIKVKARHCGPRPVLLCFSKFGNDSLNKQIEKDICDSKKKMAEGALKRKTSQGNQADTESYDDPGWCFQIMTMHK